MRQRSGWINAAAPWVAMTVVIGIGLAPAQAGPRRDGAGFCTQTANYQFKACGFEVQDNYWTEVAKCTNESNDADRAACMSDAATVRAQESQTCRDALEGRKEFCREIGEARYDPDFDEQRFETDYNNLPAVNPFFPIKPGNHWEFAGRGETVVVDVLNKTKLIDGVTCIVVRDVVSRDGSPVEATDDWLAQAKDGNIWYCGEEVKDYETFPGDRPADPELFSIDGTFKVDRDGAKAGILYQRYPVEDLAYREEFAIGSAEDVSKVESANYTYGRDAELDQWVPAALGSLMCGGGGCVVTENQNLRNPGDLALKYYSPGIGVFLEVHPDSGDTLQITGCNVDSRCNRLPRPAGN